MQKRLPQFTSYHILFLLMGMCFYYTPIKAQFGNLGPTGSSNYKATGTSFDNGTGQIHCFGIPPGYQYGALCPNSSNVIFAGSPYSGLWKSVDGGQSWNVVESSQHLEINSVCDIAFNYQCPNFTMYIATGSSNLHWGGFMPLYSCGIYKSVDYGLTFQPITSFNSTKNFNNGSFKLTTKITVSPYNDSLIFVASSDGLYRTINKGVSWDLVLLEADGDETPGIWSVEFSPNDPNTVYCSGKQVYKSTGNGTLASIGALNSFTILTNPLLPSTKIVSGLVDFGAGYVTQNLTYNLSYANVNLKIANNGGLDKIYTSAFTKYTYSGGGTPNTPSITANEVFSKNGTTAWVNITDANYTSGAIQASDRIKLDVKPGTPNTVLAGNRYPFVTTNAGFSWSQIDSIHDDFHAFQFFPSGDSALIGCDGGIYKYYVGNNSTKEQNNGLSLSFIWAVSASPTKKGYLAAGKNDTNTDWFDGQNWHQVGGGGDGYPPVLWDRYLDSVFYFEINGIWNQYDVVGLGGSQHGLSANCFNYSSDLAANVFQNPSPYRQDEFYYPNKKGVNMTVGPVRATNFQVMDNTSDNIPAMRKIFVSKGDPTSIYTWAWSFGPNTSPTALYRFNRSAVATSNFSSNCALTACTPPNSCYDKLLPLPASLYSTTVSCSSCGGTQVPIANYFPISGVAISNTNPNKKWVSFEFMRERKADIPLQYIFTVTRYDITTNTWVADDAGLPKVPITNILYVDGSNDFLICSTITGQVFYKQGTSSWQELDANLPHSYISSLEFNYCERKLYVGQIGRGVWVYGFNSGTPVAMQSLTLPTGATSWTGAWDIASSLIIPSGSSLTLTNATLNMASGTKITIQRGGRLFVDASSITNSCGELWQGIEILGDPTQAQVPLPTQANLTGPNLSVPTSIPASNQQGIAIIKNSTVENMGVGIILNLFDPYTAPTVYTYSGGQLYAYNDTFRNNLTSIAANFYNPSTAISPYGYIQSEVDNCVFTNTKNKNFQQHISLNTVKGFQIRGCLFHNQVYSAGATSQSKGYGVRGLNATAEIVTYKNQAGTIIKKNRFYNFTYGVYFSNGSVLGDASHNLKVTEAAFSGNTYGIYLNGVKYPTLVKDSINIPHLNNDLVNLPPLTSLTVSSYGMYLTGCSSYKIQNDTILSVPSGTGVAYGLLVNNGAAQNELIRRNVIAKCNYGIIPVGKNSDDVATGLLLQCNDFYQNQNYDIWLCENNVNGTIVYGSIKKNQGSDNDLSQASDNHFFEQSPSIPSFQLIRKWQTNIYNYTYQNSSNFIPTRVNQTYPITLFPNGVPSGCPEQIVNSDISPVFALKTKDSIGILKDRLLVVHAYYTKKLQAKEDLGGILDSMAAEPFVTENILYKVIAQPTASDYFSQLLKVLSIHAGNTDSTAFYLAKAHLPFTPKILDRLQNTLQNKASSESAVLQRIADYQNTIENGVTAQYEKLIDSGQITAALGWIKDAYPSANMQRLWAEACMQYGTDADKDLAIKSLLSTPVTSVNHHLGEVFQLIETQNKSANNRSNIDKAKLYQLYTNGDVAGWKAAALLAQAEDTLLKPYLPVAEEKTNSSQEIDPWGQIALEDKKVLLVYPSPANLETTLFYQLPDATLVKIEVLDMLGRNIYSRTMNTAEGSLLLSTQGWAMGSYLVKITDETAKESKTAHLIITH